MAPQVQQKISLIAASTIAACLFVYLGLIQFPGMHADADGFFPITINVASGKGWVVNGYTPALLMMGGDNAYAGHGFLFPYIVGNLFGATSGKALYLWSGVINACAVYIYTLTAYYFSKRRSLITVLYAVSMGICAGVVGIAIQGRPEQLGLLFIPAPIFLWLRWERILFFNVGSIFTIFILSAISPLLGIYWWVGYSVFLARVTAWNTKQYIASQLIVTSASFATYSVAINLITGSSIREYVERILIYGSSPYVHGHVIFALGSLRLLAPLWPIPLLVISLTSVIWLLKNKLFFVLVLVSIPTIYLSKLVGPYIYLPFVPTAIMILKWRIHELWRPLKRSFKYIIAAYLSLYVLVFGRYILLSGLYLQSSNTYQDTLEKVQNIQLAAEKSGNFVGYSMARFPSLAVFGSPGRELIAVNARSGEDWALEGFESVTNNLIEYIIVQQQGQAGVTPKPSLGEGKFLLIENDWTSLKARLFGIKLGGYQPGYHIAIYKKREI